MDRGSAEPDSETLALRMQEVDARTVLGLNTGAQDSEIEAAYRARVAELRERLDQAPDSRTRNRLERQFAGLKEARETLLSNLADPTALPDEFGRPTNDQLPTEISPTALERDAFPTSTESVDSETAADDTQLPSDPVFHAGPVVHSPSNGDPISNALPQSEDLSVLRRIETNLSADYSNRPLDKSSDSTIHEPEAETETFFEPVDRSSSSVPPKTSSESERTRVITPRFPSSPPLLPSEFTQAIAQDPDRPAQSGRPPTVSTPAPATQQSPFIRKGNYNRWLLFAIAGSGFCLACVPAVFWWLSHLDKHTVSGTNFAQASPSLQKPTYSAASSVTPVTAATPVPKPTAVATTTSTLTPAATSTPYAIQIPSATETPSTSKASPASTALTKIEIQTTKAEVIKRINAIPEYSSEQKALLIQKLDKARSMERLTVVRFGLGETSLQRVGADELVKIFNTPAMQTKLADKTVILIVAGYADPGGRAETNLTLSRERAEAVASVLKWRLKLTNVVQTIGMGETELLSNGRPDQNRAVEVWAVSPI